MSGQHLSISGISQLLLTDFLPNFKGRFSGQSLTNANHQGRVKTRLRQSQDKVRTSSCQGQGEVLARSKRGQGKVERQGRGKINVWLKQSNHNHNHNYNLMGFGTIEINLVDSKICLARLS